MSVRRLVLVLPVVGVAVLALVGPWLISGSISAPVSTPYAPSSSENLLGTDVLGRDVLNRVLAGGRSLILQALGATLLGTLVGPALGIWPALTHRRRAAAVLLRTVDAFAAIPALLLLLLLASGTSGSDAVVSVAIALIGVPFSVRVSQEGTARLAGTAYVRTARARGEAPLSLLRHDILPGLAPLVLAETGLRFVAATQLAATAGFLGLGAGAPAANWGRMVAENSTGLKMNPLPVIVPAALLVVLAVGVSLTLDRAARLRAVGPESAGGLV